MNDELKNEPSTLKKPRAVRPKAPRVRSSAESLAQALGIPKSFLDDLETEKDWAFVVKVHALMESALNRMIVKALRKKELAKFVSRLATSAPDTGKLAIIKALHMLSPEHQKFIQGFSTLRNTYAHDARNLKFSIIECIDSMLPAEKGKECLKNLKAHLGEKKRVETEQSNVTYTAEDFVRKFPRETIIFGARAILFPR